MIEVPAKIWRPKVVSRYTTPEFHGDDIDGILDYSQYGNCLYRTDISWSDDSGRDDIINFDCAAHTEELTTGLRFDTTIDPLTRDSIVEIIKKYWDCFIKEGAQRPILGYEFGIDTGGAKPVCCKKPSYGLFESKVIMEQVGQLKSNKWIRRCGGPWGSMIVLAQKPHQEHITAIKDFVWRMCVSYRKLNAVTKPFQFPIPRCDDAVIGLGCGAVVIWIISLRRHARLSSGCSAFIRQGEIGFLHTG